MRLTSLEGKLALLLCAVMLCGILVVAALSHWLWSPWIAAAVAPLILIPFALFVARSVTAPMASLLRSAGRQRRQFSRRRFLGVAGR